MAPATPAAGRTALESYDYVIIGAGSAGSVLANRLSEDEGARVLREMAEAAELFTARRDPVIVLEDLHWGDVSTLDWMMYLARRREPARR